MSDSHPGPHTIALPDCPALVVGLRNACFVTTSGEVEIVSHAETRKRIGETQPIVCHRLMTAKRLDTAPFQAFDVLELFAFVRPAEFSLPTPLGLAETLGVPIPQSIEKESLCLLQVVGVLLAELQRLPKPEADIARGLAFTMAKGGWLWGYAVLEALGGGAPHSQVAREAFKVWNRVDKWDDEPPEAQGSHWPVEPVEARARLVKLLGPKSEKRPQQMEYTGLVTKAFDPKDQVGTPPLVLAEAGTGVGKTLGYIAPASVWAEKNAEPVWISTYTRNLQRQLDAELDRLFPDPIEKAEKVVIRKGRENYFCLLNFDEAVARVSVNQTDAIALGIMARWVDATRDGDMQGGDFPAWLGDLLGRHLTQDLTDTRGECIFGACSHYSRCFIESAQAKSRRAQIVVANHALVMIQAALGGDQGLGPKRYVIDEGHHLFDAADSAFSAHLSAVESADLRRWFLGAESKKRSRSRGLKARLEDLAATSEPVNDAMYSVLKAARCLPASGWISRLSGGEPIGPAEEFFVMVRRQVLARAGNNSEAYSLETETQPPVEGLVLAARRLRDDLSKIAKPVGVLIAALANILDTEADSLESNQKNRIESLMQSLERRSIQQIAAWAAMLDALEEEPPKEVVDWMSLERWRGRDIDVGLHRHWIDPVKAFAEVMATEAQGLLVTSATLTDHGPEEPEDRWAWAETRSGARHFEGEPKRASVPSPFNYEEATRVIVVTDVDRNNPDRVAAAYRELFIASHGGALGLFTAIRRLRAVYERLAPDLDERGITLFAQHIDAMDTGTLIDMFRADTKSCLLGTDAVRDGVDIPGPSLQLIVFDRVPWPRPDILHKARREAFGGKAYDERLVRLKLAQAFGRLIRQRDDRGVFVMLDKAMPSRLLTAFPKGVGISRLGLKDALLEIRDFLGSSQ